MWAVLCRSSDPNSRHLALCRDELPPASRGQGRQVKFHLCLAAQFFNQTADGVPRYVIAGRSTFSRIDFGNES
jgi:hypothetical protein